VQKETLHNCLNSSKRELPEHTRTVKVANHILEAANQALAARGRKAIVRAAHLIRQESDESTLEVNKSDKYR
jgi:hypothetical protein